MHVIDLRSDTVTLPTPEMREAMYRAEVGDDGWGEDPSVNRLQEVAAERMGKEAGLLVASGTMGNLVAILTHCRRGDEVILGDQAHTFIHEVGGIAALGGLHVHTLPNDARGMLDPAAVEAAIRPENVHYPRTGLLCLENTHNRCGGAVLTPQDMAALAQALRRGSAQVVRPQSIPIHLDGARIFNAAVALGLEARGLTQEVASVTFCLSKGLAAPVGSVLCGSNEFIAEARRYRQMVGGGMRQAGIIAAAGLVALECMVERLAEDHDNAQRLAKGLAQLPHISLDPASVQTNIVIFTVKGPSTSLPTGPAYRTGRQAGSEGSGQVMPTGRQAQELLEKLAALGVKVSHMGGPRLRMVTHYGIDRGDIDEALAVTARILRGVE